jgi:hypothetical protein
LLHCHQGPRGADEAKPLNRVRDPQLSERCRTLTICDGQSLAHLPEELIAIGYEEVTMGSSAKELPRLQ